MSGKRWGIPPLSSDNSSLERQGSKERLHHDVLSAISAHLREDQARHVWHSRATRLWIALGHAKPGSAIKRDASERTPGSALKYAVLQKCRYQFSTAHAPPIKLHPAFHPAISLSLSLDVFAGKIGSTWLPRVTARTARLCQRDL